MNGLGGLAADPGGPSFLGSMLPLLIGMGVVVLVLGGFLWLLRRRFGAGGPMRIDCAVMGTLPVGPRERLVVVRIEGRRLVLGVTGNAVGLLCELPEGSSSPPQSVTGFGTTLSQAFERWRGPRQANDGTKS